MDMDLLDVALKRVSQEMHVRGNYPEAICLVRRDDLRIIAEAAIIEKQPIFGIEHVLHFLADVTQEDAQKILKVIYERV